MENSILTSTKKILGVAEDYTTFDLDIITHINASFGVLSQLGIISSDGFNIEDKEAEWGDLDLSKNLLNLVKSYIFLKTQMFFDPPATSFLIEAKNNQIEQLEWRMNVFREEAEHPLSSLIVIEEEVA